MKFQLRRILFYLKMESQNCLLKYSLESLFNNRMKLQSPLFSSKIISFSLPFQISVSTSRFSADCLSVFLFRQLVRISGISQVNLRFTWRMIWIPYSVSKVARTKPGLLLSCAFVQLHWLTDWFSVVYISPEWFPFFRSWFPEKKSYDKKILRK